jgi:hypothetical protein
MKKVYISLLLVLIASVIQAQDFSKRKKNKFKASLVVATEFSFEFDTKSLQKSELILKPEFTYSFNRKTKFVFKGQIYNEFQDHLEKGKPNQNTASSFNKRWFIGDRTALELREFYVYTSVFKKLRLTIGKQQIVWGQTDGLKLLDVVNPQNFREFMLDDFENSRIPLWSLKAEFDIADIGVQFIWIPDNTYHITQDFDAPFFTKSMFREVPEGISTQIENPIKPNRFIADSDVGLKVSTFKNGWDLSLNYLYYYEDLPAFYTEIITNTTPVAKISPVFERQHLLGGTFNKVVGSSTFRGELAYVFNQHFTSTATNAFKGVAHSNVYKSALGIDYIKGEHVVSFQLFSDWIVSDIDPYNRDRFETNTSLQISKELLNDDLKAEILWVHNANHGDGYAIPKLSYWLNSNTQLLLSSIIFYGNERQLFGQFSDRSQVSFGFVWGI